MVSALFKDQAVLIAFIFRALHAVFVSFPPFTVAIPASSCHEAHFNVVLLAHL
jgi:hypothetical protein